MSEVIHIANIENYTQEIIDGALILTPKKQYITEVDLLSIIETHSSIIECVVKEEEEIISTGKNYRSVAVDIWKNMPVQNIFEHSTFNFKLTKEDGKKGYNWCEEIRMSFQNKSAKETLKEILKMIKLNKLTINMSIKLKTDSVVHFKIE